MPEEDSAPGYDLPEEIAALKACAITSTSSPTSTPIRDAAPNLCHYTGWIILRTGTAPTVANRPPGRDHRRDRRQEDRPHHALPDPDRDRHRRSCAPSSPTRTRTRSTRPKCSPLELLQRTVRPRLPGSERAGRSRRTRASWCARACCRACSTRSSDSQKQGRRRGQARLDQYFTGLRDLEQQFDHQLTKPEPIAACVAPKSAEGRPEDRRRRRAGRRAPQA